METKVKFKFFKYILILIIILGYIFFKLYFSTKNYEVAIQPDFIFADNQSSCKIEILATNYFGTKFNDKKIISKISVIEGLDLIDILNLDTNFSKIEIKSKFKSGLVKIKFDSELFEYPIIAELKIMDNLVDSDRDGFPDITELNTVNDRTNFRKWFANIALSQFYVMSDDWQKEERDCSGLIRYAFKEALKVHDNKWLSNQKFIYDNNISDIQKYNYPDIPILGTKTYKKNNNVLYSRKEIDSNFSNFVDAKNLMNYSLFFCPKI